MNSVLIVVIVVVVLLLVVGINAYNSLKTKNIAVDNAWSDVTVALKRRADLIPNLVETVKGYAKHESSVFEEVTAARSAIGQLKIDNVDPKMAAKAEEALSSSLGKLIAVAESYPDLKASQNFMQLQASLTDTEDKVAAARRFYNLAVRTLNTAVETFPSNLFVGMAKVQTRDFYEVSEAEQAKIADAPKVEF
ncbi:MAG: LemA family protein [Lactobacillaceae bacterium]|jgi:LemA protein|nr:LemA family protein [Lactobacillaceae bacterium]